MGLRPGNEGALSGGKLATSPRWLTVLFTEGFDARDLKDVKAPLEELGWPQTPQ